MVVSDLMKALSDMPPNAPVGYVWDGSIRSDVDHVWLARNGVVALSHDDEVVYDLAERPVSAPDDKYWHIVAHKDG